MESFHDTRRVAWLTIAEALALSEPEDSTLLFQAKTYTAAGLPSAAEYPRGIVYVSDESVLAYSDGSTWQRVVITGGAGSFTTLAASGLISANGGQIKFPATQNPSSNANTLDDYEEGTWTPIDSSGASLSFAAATGSYVKIGKSFTAQCTVVYPATASGANAIIGGLPYTLGASNAVAICYTTDGTATVALGAATTALVALVAAAGAAARTNANLSGDTVAFTLVGEV